MGKPPPSPRLTYAARAVIHTLKTIPTSTDVISDGESISPAVSCEIPRVLIADDSRFHRMMLASVLMPKKCEVVFAVDALQTFLMASPLVRT